MLQDYTPILVMFLMSLFVPLFVISLSAVLGPKRGSKRKLAPYESGMEPIGPAMRRFPVKFYVVAMLFILFDIEAIFFFPYALAFRDLGLYGLGVMGVFLVLLVVGFVYEWKKGALRWD
ncbi:MAG: NADH-quinone oxidoreductase subunit A [Chloroflexaceae bacterium]|nr:NADH-quinone oxidoreductase subunit A [Chloroflexaceae bacterium]